LADRVGQVGVAAVAVVQAGAPARGNSKPGNSAIAASLRPFTECSISPWAIPL